MASEHEKLLTDQEYDYRDPELQSMIKHCKDVMKVINTTTDMEKRADAVNSLFHKSSEGLTINGKINVLYGDHISVGDDVFINGNCTLQDSNLITMGDRVIIAPDTKLYCGEHSLDVSKRFGTRSDGSKYLITYTEPITIGSDVWIGGNVTIIAGVTIGSNVIVGAGAVVTSDIPDNTVSGGVPAKTIKSLPPLN